jgi:hypothetical protein
MTISLYYPTYGSATSSVVLKNPDYGNSEQYNNNVLFHLGMDGTIYSYKKSKKQTLLLTFSAVSKAKIAEFTAFLTANVGYELGYVDTLGGIWRVRIINNPLETATTTGVGECEISSMTIQMRAEYAGDAYNNTLIDDATNVLVDDLENVLVYA